MIVEGSYKYLYGTHDSLVLNLVRSRLQAAGIDTRVHGEQFSSLYPLHTLEARIYVPESEFQASHELLEDILSSMNRRAGDLDFSDSDLGDIQYEEGVYKMEQGIIEIPRQSLIVILIILFLVSIVVLLTLK